MSKSFFGKKGSIHKKLIIFFSIAIILVIIATMLGWHLVIDVQVLEKLVEIHVETEEEVNELLTIVRRGTILLIFNVIVISIILMGIVSKNMLKPIKKIKEATKKVAEGDFSIKLETKRKDEIGELTNNFNKMVEDLGSIECLQKEFIDNVSHEIKTPISSIQGFAELLKDENLTQEEKEEYANIIIEESNRLLNLSTNMLKLSKLQNQNKIAKKEQIDVAEQIRKAISLLEPKWSKKEIIFNVSLQEKYFFGDEELMFQVWINLIDNAIKFSNHNGKIDITLNLENDYLVVQIRDYGKGMDEEKTKKIFSGFYQIDKSHSSEGSGLGLAIVQRTIELSKGTIEVKSKVNEGTTMIVKLPVKNETNKVIIE